MTLSQRLYQDRYLDDADFEKVLQLFREYADCVDEVALMSETTMNAFFPMEAFEKTLPCNVEAASRLRGIGVRASRVSHHHAHQPITAKIATSPTPLPADHQLGRHGGKGLLWPERSGISGAHSPQIRAGCSVKAGLCLGGRRRAHTDATPALFPHRLSPVPPALQCGAWDGVHPGDAGCRAQCSRRRTMAQTLGRP